MKPVLRVISKDVACAKITINETRFLLKLPTATSAEEALHLVDEAKRVFDLVWKPGMMTFREQFRSRETMVEKLLQKAFIDTVPRRPGAIIERFNEADRMAIRSLTSEDFNHRIK